VGGRQVYCGTYQVVITYNCSTWNINCSTDLDRPNYFVRPLTTRHFLIDSVRKNTDCHVEM
jgi:hypothetical protein